MLIILGMININPPKQKTMYQKDYILRMIEMIGEFIALLMGKIKNGDLEEAKVFLENAYNDFLRKDAAFFMKISAEDLTDTLIGEHNYINGHLEILSRLFYAEAELAAAEKDYKRAYEFYHRSLLLLNFVIKESKSFSFEDQKSLKEMEEKMGKIENLK